MSTLWLVEGKSKGGDDVATLIMAIYALVCESILGGGEWEVDGKGGDTGNGRDGICSSGDDSRVSGYGGGVGIIRNLSTSSSKRNGTVD
ncbi:hypothetical protein Tco_0139583 [Tanacetum coccineum]